MWPFVVAGLVVGSIYGLTAVGLVLTYKASGVFNFAHGAVATVSAYAFYSLHVQAGLAWPIAAVIAVFGVGCVLGLLFEILGRRLSGANLSVQVTSTVGVLLVVQAAIVLTYGTTETRIVPVFLPAAYATIAGTNVQYAQIITFVLAVLATLALGAMFKFASLGRNMRALVDDPPLLAMSGVNTTGVRRWAWLIGITFAAASGVLFAALQPLDPLILTLLVVQAFGAAAIGGFRNLPMTFAGGLIIGVLASVSTRYFTDGIWLGVPAAFPFIVLFVVLLFFPRRYLATGARTIPMSRDPWTSPARAQAILGAVCVALLALVPLFAGIHLVGWTTGLASVIVFLSLGILVRESGQLSLGQVAFMAIGVSTYAHLTNAGVPWYLSLLASAAVAIPIGALLSIPAIRLTGLYLALATLGFGIVLQYMFYSQDFMFGYSGAGLSVPRPPGLESDSAFYWFVLGVTTVVAALVFGLVRGRLGRLLRSMADSSTALRSLGVSVTVTRVLVFCISASLAAFGGALAGMAQGTVSLLSYPPMLSLNFLALIMIVVGRVPWYAVIAAFGAFIIPTYMSGLTVTYWLQIVFGLFAIALAFSSPPSGPPPMVRAFLERIGGRRPVSNEQEPHSAEADERVASVSGQSSTLELADVHVQFGGLVAVDGLSLNAPRGRITGLIGPNGAGKTTSFNAANGMVRPSRGRVALGGRVITRTTVDRRARLGLGRTFQRIELFESLTVLENVEMGHEGALAGRRPLRHLVASRRHRDEVRRAAWSALALCEIAQLADQHVNSLPTGQRRLVELARCLAGSFSILLLDEPSSGLDHEETRRFAEVLRHVVQERGVGVLLVEHDMSLVMDLCDHIYVLDFGRLIFDGTPAEVQASDVVQSAYLGTDDAPEIRALEDASPTS